MGQVSYTELRQNLARYLDKEVDDRAPLLVTRRGGRGNVVILSEEEFDGLQETAHLHSNSRNAAHVLASIREADLGLSVNRDLVFPRANSGT